MRLPLLKPSELDEEQKALYDSIREVTDVAFANFKFMKRMASLSVPSTPCCTSRSSARQRGR
jgi:hypothetical protein